MVLETKGEIAELADTINGMIDTLAVFAEQLVSNMLVSYRANAGLLRALRQFSQGRFHTPFCKRAAKLEMRGIEHYTALGFDVDGRVADAESIPYDDATWAHTTSAVSQVRANGGALLLTFDEHGNCFDHVPPPPATPPPARRRRPTRRGPACRGPRRRSARACGPARRHGWPAAPLQGRRHGRGGGHPGGRSGALDPRSRTSS